MQVRSAWKGPGFHLRPHRTQGRKQATCLTARAVPRPSPNVAGTQWSCFTSTAHIGAQVNVKTYIVHLVGPSCETWDINTQHSIDHP